MAHKTYTLAIIDDETGVIAYKTPLQGRAFSTGSRGFSAQVKTLIYDEETKGLRQVSGNCNLTINGSKLEADAAQRAQQVAAQKAEKAADNAAKLEANAVKMLARAEELKKAAGGK